MNELLNMLNDITRITISINGLYNHMICLDQNKENNNNYNYQKNNILNELKIFKNKEDQLYKNFNNYDKCVKAINYLITNSIKHGTNPKYNNVILRMISKLKDIAFDYGFDNYIFINEFKNNVFYQYLQKQNINEDQIFNFLQEFIPDFNNQINERFIEITNSFLSKYPNDKRKNDIIIIKFERYLTISGSLEDSFILNQKNNNSIDYKKYNINNKTIIEFTSYVLYQNCFNIIGKLLINNYSLNDIIQFIANTNYLSLQALINFKNQIESLNSLNTDLKNLLVEHLDSEIIKHNNKGRTL